jgi:hypothetical protein
MGFAEVIMQILYRVYPDPTVWALVFLLVIAVACLLNRIPASASVHFGYILAATFVGLNQATGVFDFVKIVILAIAGIALAIGILKFWRR